MLIRLAAVLALASMLTGCGGASDQASPETTISNDALSVSNDPLGCLDAAGLSNVEERDSDLWRGNHESPFYTVIIHLLPSKMEARNLARDAVDVYSAQGGKYVVTGPAKPSAGGLVTADEGAEASSLVAEVASCLSTS